VHFFSKVHQPHGKCPGSDSLSADAHHENAAGFDDRLKEAFQLFHILFLKNSGVFGKYGPV